MSRYIWELVHCLSSTERSSFKRHVSASRKKEELIYVRMFDSIYRMTIYKDKDFIKLFGKGNNISRMKNYLYTSLLETISETTSHADNILRCKKHMNTAWILYQKGLTEQSKKIVDKVVLMAQINNDLYSEAEALSLQRLIMMNELNLPGVKDSMAQEAIIREKIVQQQAYELLFVEFVTYSFKKGNVINATDRLKLEEFVKDERLQDASKCMTVAAKSYFYRIYTLYNGMIGNYPMMYENARKRFELYVKKEITSIDIQNVINSCNNYIESCLILEEYKTATSVCDYLRNLKTPSIFYEARKIIRLTIVELQLQLSTKTSLNHKDLTQDIGKCFTDYERFIRADERLELLFLVVTNEFNRGDFKKARTWIKEYYKLNKSQIRIDLQLYIMIINVYINYLQKDMEYMAHLIQTLERFEKNEEILDNYEQKLLAFLKREMVRFEKSVEVDLSILTSELNKLKSKRNEMSLAKYIQFNPIERN